jgi:hypothetical protein
MESFIDQQNVTNPSKKEQVCWGPEFSIIGTMPVDLINMDIPRIENSKLLWNSKTRRNYRER